MDFIFSAEITIPLFQLVLLLGLIALSALFGRMKLAVLITYGFTLYWGYFLNQDLLFDYVENLEFFIYLYFGFGVMVALLAMIGFLMHEGR